MLHTPFDTELNVGVGCRPLKKMNLGDTGYFRGPQDQ